MSLHKSLSTGGKLSRTRNVWTRAERLARLTEEGRYLEGESVFNLPKVRTQLKAKGKKKKKEAKEEKEK